MRRTVLVSIALVSLGFAHNAAADSCKEGPTNAEDQRRSTVAAEEGTALERAGRYQDAAHAFEAAYQFDCTNPELLLDAARNEAHAASAIKTTTTTTTAAVVHVNDTTNVRHHGAAPWILTGFGVATLTAGIVTFVAGSQRVAHNENTPFLQADTATQMVTQSVSGQTMEAVGLAVGALGFASTVGGLVWHFTEKTGPVVRIAPSVGAGYSGASVVGRF